MISSVNSLVNRLANRTALELIISALFGYILVIFTVIFVFIPTGERMGSAGYSIVDYQLAWFTGNMAQILNAWTSLQEVLIYQLWADYIFIIGGLIGDISLFLIFAKFLDEKWQLIAFVGLGSAFLAHLFDALENIFGLLIAYNPLSYNEMFVLVQSFFALLKFILLPFVYGMMVVCIFLLIMKKTHNTKN
jgi:hypothetical protein